MKTAELRSAYLQFFAERNHRVVPSSTLVPHNDPTLLFTNAGMNQFKDPLLGKTDPGYRRATSAQRCVRAGGKHNDLENVGYTARHHTLFEMMGNFSFGDYFKDETIAWAWEFVTEVLRLEPDRIWVTVHPTDAESRAIWQNVVGVPVERVIDHEDNFWAMGDTGPCGPCTELFYDHGPAVAGGPPGSADEDGDRYIEFWNLVFPQFDRSEAGELNPLPQPGVDTGMGLERMAAILQGVHTNYEIDLFAKLIRAVGEFADIGQFDDMLANASVRVIADHIRSSAFLIADGVRPGNEDRAYVLRRIIRRGLRHGYRLNIREPFFHRLVDVLADEMGDAYPVLNEQKAQVTQSLAAEEAKFGETLAQGMTLLEGHIGDLSGSVIPGDVVFQLYDTYGFPADLTADVARERDLTLDMAGFDAAMQAQRERGRAAASFSASLGQKVHVAEAVNFKGYETLQDQGRVLAVFDAVGDPQDQLTAGEEGVVALDQTPFYAESGGQVGDTGRLLGDGVEFVVTDTQVSGEQHLHIGHLVNGVVSANATLRGEVDAERRQHIKRHHSATHLLHAALRQTLGNHVQQKGSLVNADKLRFDFSHEQPVSSEQLTAIEDLVNQQVLHNSPVTTELMDHDAAMQRGAMALFGEKYGDEVRVLTMGEGFSVELCGGTHTERTGDIGPFKILAETGIAAGVRRIEAVSGSAALAQWQSDNQVIESLADLLKGSSDELVEKTTTLLQEQRRLQKTLEQLEQKMAASQGADMLDQAVDIEGVTFLAAKVEGDNKAMMQTLDSLKAKLDRSVLLLAQESGGKVGLVAGVSKSLTDTVSAADLIGAVGPLVGAKGGGRADLARAGGGSQASELPAAFERAREWVTAQLN